MVFKRHCLSARVVPQRSRQIQFRGSVRVFYHSPDRQGMQNYLCFIITKSSLCPVSFFMSSLQHQASHSTGSTFWGRAFGTPRRPRPPSARSLGQAKGGGGGWRQHTGLGMHFASLLFSLLPGFPPFLALPPRRPSSGLRRAAMATPKGQARPPSPARRGPAARRTPDSSPRPFCPSFVAEIPLSGAIPSRPPAPRPRP